MNTYFGPNLSLGPEWRRAVHVSGAGEIYVTCTILGLLTEEEVLAIHAKDGARLLTFQGHFYVTFDWLKKHVPAAFAGVLAELHTCMKHDQSLHAHEPRRFGDEFYSWN